MFILRSNDGMAQYQICKIDTYVVYFDDALAVFHKSSRQIIFHVIFLKKKDFFAITVRHHIHMYPSRILWLHWSFGTFFALCWIEDVGMNLQITFLTIICPGIFRNLISVEKHFSANEFQTVNWYWFSAKYVVISLITHSNM